ncbi:MAG: hypothetical protein ACTIJ6_10325 [Leucobacter sp.]
MKKLMIVCIAASLSLAGCTTVAAKPTPAVPEIPRVETGPVLLTDEEAGERYLSIVCQPNSASDAAYEAIIAGEEEYRNGGDPAVDTVKSSSAEHLRVTRLAIEVLDDEYYTWPESVVEFVPHIRSTFMASLSPLQATSNVTRYEDAYSMSWPESTPEQQSAAQEIRYQLGLDADTTASCIGYETALEELHTKMVELNEELAAQEERDAKEAEKD